MLKFMGKSRSSLTAGFEIKELSVFSNEIRQTGTLMDKNNQILRGTPMVLGKKPGCFG